jgi:23S rRNA (adenine2503-C2)-methyltransferase
MKDIIIGKNFEEIEKIITDLKIPKYTTNQIFEWLYKKQVYSFDLMTNISKKHREILKEKFEFGLSKPVGVEISNDGTKKYLFRTKNNLFVESAYIPDKDRATLCLSTQVGCKMGCKFCMTGKQGFQANLTTDEILNQILSLPEKNLLTNLVFMGMGEPLDNYENLINTIKILTSENAFAWSPKRITVSTIGIINELKKFINDCSCHVAISLHSPFENQRKELMPVENSNPIKEVIEIVRSYNFSKQRRISFEYILFKNFNDTQKHVKEIAKLLNGIRCRINLIRFHPFPGAPFQTSDEISIVNFKNELQRKGFITTIRASRGFDISAACGLLSTKKNIL